MNAKKLALSCAALGLVAGGAFLGGRALATGGPTLTPLTYGGVLTDPSGKPYGAAQDVTLRFYDSPTATVAKCTSPPTQAEANTGRFQVVLPSECVQAVHDAPDLWTEATVGPAKTVLPRTHVGAVPYALEADSAKQAGTAAAATGALKASLDSLASDVAGLKAAGPGGSGGAGGGPWVVDASGAKIGHLIQIIEVATPGYGDTVPAKHEYFHDVQTSTGYIVRVLLDGKSPDRVMFFTDLNCKGAGTIHLVPGGFVSNKTAFFSEMQQQFYVPDGPASGISVSGAKVTTKSLASGPLCNNQTATYSGVAVHPVTLGTLGLPAKLVPPLTVVP